MNSLYTLSMVINFHREGAIAEKTLKNIHQLLQEQHNWQEVKVIAVLDNTDTLTENIIYQYQSLFNQIEKVKFKDLAHARNYAVSLADTNFIVCADGDDYVTHNALQALYETFYNHYNALPHSSKNFSLLEENDHIAVFPSHVIGFPSPFQVKYTDSNEMLIQNIRFSHCYNSRIAIAKDLFLKYKLRENTAPYGYEDWDLNNRLLANGVQFKIADYRFYYRGNNDDSLLANQVKQKHIVRNSEIYSNDMANNSITETSEQKSTITENNEGYIKRFFSYVKQYYRSFSRTKKHPTADPFYADRIFLTSYHEEIYETDVIPTFDTGIFRLEYTVQSKVYNALILFLQGKKKIAFLSSGEDERKVIVTDTVDKTNEIATLENKLLLSPIWFLINEENQMHIIVKAIINSSVKTVYTNIESVLKSQQYYHAVYTQHHVSFTFVE